MSIWTALNTMAAIQTAAWGDADLSVVLGEDPVRLLFRGEERCLPANHS